MKGIYLEEIINKGNELMIKQLINKTREVNFALLTAGEINNMHKDIDKALSKLWSLDRQHYLTAERYADMSNRESILDHFLGIDSVLSDNVNRQLIGIDCTCKPGISLINKIEKHKKFLPCYNILSFKKVVVVYIHNADLIEGTNKASFVYKLLKQIIAEINKPLFLGGITIDAKDLIK